MNFDPIETLRRALPTDATEAHEALDALVAGAWRKVADKAPQGREHLVFIPHYPNEVTIAQRVTDVLWRTQDHRIVDPTHWMPIPEPPAV